MDQVEQFRPGFEAWARKETYSLERDDEGYYLFSDTLAAWHSWTAAKLEASTEPSEGDTCPICEQGKLIPLKLHHCSACGLEIGTSEDVAENAEAMRRHEAREDEAKDAARYRWLRDHARSVDWSRYFEAKGVRMYTTHCRTGAKQMDNDIDAAIEAQAKAQDEK